MVHRKAPTLEEATELFAKEPDKMLNDWAEEWGVTHERVRQLRIASGVPQRGAYNEDTANTILDIIRTGRGGLSTPRTYEEVNIGYERFKSWIEEEEGLSDKVQQAQKEAEKYLKDPIEKQCKYCRQWIEVQNFKRNQKYLDGYTKFCVACLEVLKAKKEELGEERVKNCLSCRKDLPTSKFTRNPNSKDGLKLFCKDCHKTEKRKKRRRNAQI
tara:strand:+ start:2711 stop:3352 length:642 start_codon:yes stop_codon:yes gene_type:complete